MKRDKWKIGNYCLKLANMKTKIDNFGRVLIPRKIRKASGLNPGDTLEIEQSENQILITGKPSKSGLVKKDGLLVYKSGISGEFKDYVKTIRDERIKAASGL